jgi:hypothetical protein
MRVIIFNGMQLIRSEASSTTSCFLFTNCALVYSTNEGVRVDLITLSGEKVNKELEVDIAEYFNYILFKL